VINVQVEQCTPFRSCAGKAANIYAPADPSCCHPDIGVGARPLLSFIISAHEVGCVCIPCSLSRDIGSRLLSPDSTATFPCFIERAVQRYFACLASVISSSSKPSGSLVCRPNLPSALPPEAPRPRTGPTHILHPAPQVDPFVGPSVGQGFKLSLRAGLRALSSGGS